MYGQKRERHWQKHGPRPFDCMKPLVAPARPRMQHQRGEHKHKVCKIQRRWCVLRGVVGIKPCSTRVYIVTQDKPQTCNESHQQTKHHKHKNAHNCYHLYIYIYTHTHNKKSTQKSLFRYKPCTVKIISTQQINNSLNTQKLHNQNEKNHSTQTRTYHTNSLTPNIPATTPYHAQS